MKTVLELPSFSSIESASKIPGVWGDTIIAGLSFGIWMYILLQSKLSLMDSLCAFGMAQAIILVTARLFGQNMALPNSNTILIASMIYIAVTYFYWKISWNMGIVEWKWPPSIALMRFTDNWPMIVSGLLSGIGLFCLGRMMTNTTSSDRGIYIIAINVIQVLVSMTIHVYNNPQDLTFRKSSFAIGLILCLVGIFK